MMAAAAELIQKSSETSRLIIYRTASNLTGRNFIIRQGKDPKHTANTTKGFIKGKKAEGLTLL